jgi:hypothetical protein
MVCDAHPTWLSDSTAVAEIRISGGVGEVTGAIPLPDPINGHTIWVKNFKPQYHALTQVIRVFRFTTFKLTNFSRMITAGSSAESGFGVPNKKSRAGNPARLFRIQLRKPGLFIKPRLTNF